jgi:hypothetical protein
VPIANVRFIIALCIIGSYLIFVGASGVYVMLYPDLSRISYLIGMSKTLLLPLTMLAIGFYFGSKPSD